jgi:hypothetical protein
MARTAVFHEKPVGKEAADLVREHFPAGSNGKRGKAGATLNVLAHMYEIAKETWPITGRGVGYRLLNRGVISTMADMAAVYDQLVCAREEGLIPWDWIVDETRELEIGTSYASKRSAYETLLYNYAHPLWDSQEYDCEIWSEKGTIRGLIQRDVLDEYRLGLRVFHGYTSATCLHDIATEIHRPLVALYVGDHDPSGCDMRDNDITARLEKYSEGECEVDFRVVALTMPQIVQHNLPSIQAKPADPRYKAYVKAHGSKCWELDALDPRQLRDILKKEVRALIDWESWNAAKDVERNWKRGFESHLRRWAEIPDPLPAEIQDAIKWGAR